MTIPPTLLPPLEDGIQESDRKNVQLESYNGSVDATVILVNDGKIPTKRTTVSVQTQHGSVTARLVRLILSLSYRYLIGSQHAPAERPAIQLNAASYNGAVAVYLPRSFRGFLTLSSKNGSIVFSDAVAAQVATFSHVGLTKRCFMGVIADALQDVGEWSGDEVVASSHNGKIRVFYVDEAKASKTSPGFFARMFGS